jgi:hypothetical protein
VDLQIGWNALRSAPTRIGTLAAKLAKLLMSNEPTISRRLPRGPSCNQTNPLAVSLVVRPAISRFVFLPFAAPCPHTLRDDRMAAGAGKFVRSEPCGWRISRATDVSAAVMGAGAGWADSSTRPSDQPFLLASHIRDITRSMTNHSIDGKKKSYHLC